MLRLLGRWIRGRRGGHRVLSVSTSEASAEVAGDYEGILTIAMDDLGSEVIQPIGLLRSASTSRQTVPSSSYRQKHKNAFRQDSPSKNFATLFLIAKTPLD